MESENALVEDAVNLDGFKVVKSVFVKPGLYVEILVFEHLEQVGILLTLPGSGLEDKQPTAVAQPVQKERRWCRSTAPPLDHRCINLEFTSIEG